MEREEAFRLASISKEMAQSERPQARRVAKKIADYTGELKQAESLRRELAKLEAVQRERVAQTQAEVEKDRALRAMANEVAEILLEEEDAITAIIELEELEARFLLSALGFRTS
jgi:hypothetical protein